MKILLVALNAKYIHSNPALYSIRAYAGEYQSYVEIAEYTINQSVSEILRDIYEKRPDVIGFSCYIWNIAMIRELFCEVKKILPNTDIYLGGPEVSYQAEAYMLQYPQLSGVMVGEGEKTWKELCGWYLGNTQELSEIRGLVHKDVDKLEFHPQLGVMNLSEIPFLYGELDKFENRIIYYESSRGCPFSCSYCLSSVDKQLRFRDISLVKKELQFFLDHKVPQVKFIDRTFNCNHDHAMAIWQYIYDHDNGITNFHFEIGADLITQEELALLAKFRPGLAQMEIGVQSTNEQTLHEIHRYVKTEHLKKVVAALKAPKNIHIHLDLIAGLPYEDLESFRQSFNDVYSMAPDQLQLGFLKVLTGTCMADNQEAYDLVYTETPPYEVLSTNWLSYADVVYLKDIEEMVEQYYNSGGFLRTVHCMERLFPTSFALYEALADFYRRHQSRFQKQSRIRGYEMLLEFLQEQGQDEKLWIPVLLLDLYGKEKLKSRPSFAPDEKLHRSEAIAFYQKEAKEHHYLPQLILDSRGLEKISHLEFFDFDVEEFIKSGNVVETPSQALFVYGEEVEVRFLGG